MHFYLEAVQKQHSCDVSKAAGAGGRAPAVTFAYVFVLSKHYNNSVAISSLTASSQIQKFLFPK